MSIDGMTSASTAIQRVARDFERRGYTVSLGELESEGERLQPDLIASRGDEVVVVEVKDRGALRADDLHQLREYVRDRPGWRVELVVAGRGPEADGAPPAAGDARQALDEARRLLEVSPASALVMSLAALGRAAVTAGETFGPEDRPNLVNVLRRATTKGIVSRGDYATLRAALDLRSAVVHGKTSEVGPTLAVEVLDLVERVADELVASRDELGDA